jgi:hypothetical protein
MNRASRITLQKYENLPISAITIRRAPLSNLITLILRLATRDKVKEVMREHDYDALYHLSMIIEFKNTTTKLVIEKNEQVSIYTLKHEKVIGAEYFKLNFHNPRATLKPIFIKMERVFGLYKVYNYSAKDRNCQDFVVGFISMLNVENLNGAYAFIKQDVSKIFDSNNVLRKLTNTLTNMYRAIKPSFFAASGTGPGSLMQISNDDIAFITNGINNAMKDTAFVHNEYVQINRIMLHRFAVEEDYTDQGMLELRAKNVLLDVLVEAAKTLSTHRGEANERFSELFEEYPDMEHEARTNIFRNVTNYISHIEGRGSDLPGSTVSMARVQRAYEKFLSEKRVDRTILKSIESEHLHMVTPKVFKLFEGEILKLRVRDRQVSPIEERRITLMHGT